MIRKFSMLSERLGKPLPIALLSELNIRLYRHSTVYRKLALKFHVPKKPKNVLFIVGSYNAGTTILKDALGLHPDVATAPIEGDLLTSELDNMEKGGWHRCLFGNRKLIDFYRRNTKINGAKCLRDWNPWIKQDKVFLEKSIANSVRMKQFREAFPGCKFLNVIRSPEAVVKGIQKRSVPTGEARSILKSDTYSDELLYQQWSYIYDLILTDSLDSDTVHCTYDEFIQSPAETLERIYTFFGLEPIAIEFSENELSVGNHSLRIRPMKKANPDAFRLANKGELEAEIKRYRYEQ